ncbi:MAG: 4-hydroxy-tetrahydrodipicolinate reductase [Candidatus Omnitrophica bacterium]|nr:4-hydroxy-tetrahydrodipicolinate reductase [Candidatus Omnitrophota bacterium]
MIKLAMAGAAGRMGKTILNLASEDKAFKITGAFEHSASPALGQDIGVIVSGEPLRVMVTKDLKKGLENADVLIDFTHPSAVAATLRSAVKAKVGYVIGTTGLSDAQINLLKAASKKIPIVQSPNMSIGVNVLFRLAELTAGILDERYDIEIFETHHRMKKDAPSGTAMKLLEILAKARGRDARKDAVYGRQGETGLRPKGKIGVLASRGGDVVGDHLISFLGDGERIELIHRASSRNAFAQGALTAAKFIAKRKNGFYNMQQVLGIS